MTLGNIISLMGAWFPLVWIEFLQKKEIWNHKFMWLEIRLYDFVCNHIKKFDPEQARLF